MTTVVDTSVVTASLVDAGPTGEWADEVIRAGRLAAPHLLPVETASILRRMVAAGSVSADSAALAHAQLLRLRAQLFPYAPLGHRVWQLRENVTPYDAWYVALAEQLDAPLATLDIGLSHALGPRCRFVTPPGA
jgi:predicted nucleic acid-binding protein